MKWLRWIIEAVSALFALVGAIFCALIGLFLLWEGGAHTQLAVLILAIALFIMAALEIIISRSFWNSANTLHES